MAGNGLDGNPLTEEQMKNLGQGPYGMSNPGGPNFGMPGAFNPGMSGGFSPGMGGSFSQGGLAGLSQEQMMQFGGQSMLGGENYMYGGQGIADNSSNQSSQNNTRSLSKTHTLLSHSRYLINKQFIQQVSYMLLQSIIVDMDW